MAASMTDKLVVRKPSEIPIAGVAETNGRMRGGSATGAIAGVKTTGNISPTYYKPAPAEVTYGPMRFLITDRPSDMTMTTFLEVCAPQMRAHISVWQECTKHNVQAVVRVCEPSYDTTALKAAGVRVLDWEFSDGSPPPKEIRDNWIELIRDTFRHVDGAGGASPCIAVHCVAGLGRAPVMVAIALIEAGVKYEDAVDMIRKQRRGALNQKQLTFLEKYKSSNELKKNFAARTSTNGGKNENCSVM